MVDFKPKSNITFSPVKKEIDETPQSSSIWGKIGEGYKKNISDVGSVAVGALKGIGSTVVGAGQLGANILSKAFGGDVSGVNRMATGLKEGVLKPQGTPQKLGFMGEQIAEFFAPGGTSTKLGKLAEIGIKGAKMAKVGGMAVKGLAEGGLALGQTALQKGGVDKEALIAGGAGTLLPATLKGATKLAGTIGKEFLGKTTGAGVASIEQVFKSPNVIKFARQSGKDAEGLQNDVLSSVKSAFSSLVNKRGQEYTKQLEKIKLNPKDLTKITSTVRDKATEILKDYEIGLNPAQYGAKKLNVLDFSNSSLIKGQEAVEKAYNDVMRWTDNTAAGLDRLKKRLFTYAGQVSPIDSGPAKSIVTELAHSVDAGLKKGVKGYEEMTSKYRQASDFLDEINSSFSLGAKAKETTIKKIIGSLRQNNEARKELLASIPGGQQILSKAAGSQLGVLMPRGLQGAVIPAAGGVVSALNPTHIPAILAFLAATSPRLVAEGVNLLGKIDRTMIKAGNLPMQIQRGLRELIIKATNQ